MPLDETILHQDTNILISNAQARIGRYVYAPAMIRSVSIDKVKPRPSLPFMLAMVGMLAFAYFTFPNLYGILLLIIVLAPTLLALLRPRPLYALVIETSEQQSQPVSARDREEIQVIADALNQARQMAIEQPPQAYQNIDAAPAYTAPGADGSFVRTIPQNCAKCDLPLTVEAIQWVDGKSGLCPRCGAPVEITWRKSA